MADYSVSVTATGIVPAVIYTGTEGSVGKSIGFEFSSDWDDLTKEVMFFDTRGNVFISPLVVDLSGEYSLPIPSEITMYGGPHKFTVRGFTIDNGYINDSLQVTGTIVTAYTPGSNPRMEGKLLPSTMDLWLYQADNSVRNSLQAAKDSGEFDGADGADAGFGIVTAYANTLASNQPASATVNISGSNAAKNMEFVFGIPRGETPGNIPDGLAQGSDGLVYLTVGGVTYGIGVSVVGKNFTILGHYTSLSDLQTAVPNPAIGDAYSVGSSTPYNVYVYDGTTNAWANYGAIGSGGSVTVDSAIVANSTNPVQSKVIQTYVTGLIPTELKNPNALSIFGSSYDGSSAVTVTMDSAMSDSSANAVQNQVIKAYIDELIGDIDTALTAINALIGTPAE